MASSSRPRSSNMSLTPRALRTFRALTRRREAFPLSVDSGSADVSTLRLVLIGSPSSPADSSNESTPKNPEPSYFEQQVS